MERGSLLCRGKVYIEISRQKLAEFVKGPGDGRSIYAAFVFYVAAKCTVRCREKDASD